MDSYNMGGHPDHQELADISKTASGLTLTLLSDSCFFFVCIKLESLIKNKGAECPSDAC